MNLMQIQYVIRFVISLFLLLILLVDTSGLYKYTFLQKLENWSYDARLNATLENTIDDKVVIIDIDEASLANVGRFPWSRNIMAQLTDNLFDYYKIDTLGFDIVFAEKDDSSSLDELVNLSKNELSKDQKFISILNKIRPSLEYDRLFVQSLAHRNIIFRLLF